LESDEESNGYETEEELHVERAHAAKVTFIDDNNNYVTLDNGDEYDHVPSVAAATSIPLPTIVLSDPDGVDISAIPVGKSNSEDEAATIDLDIKPSATKPLQNVVMNNMKPDGKEQTTLAPKLPIPADSKLPYETILDWLERQNPVMADSFAQEFNLPTNQTTRIFWTPKPVQLEHCFKSRHSPHPTSLNSDMVHCKAIEDTIPQYQELTEEGQKDLWLSALASNDTTLIRELTSICVKNTKANSGTQLAKLAKDLLTHSEKHKVNELKYEEQARKRRLYFHKWLMQLAAVIKMFSQTAPVLDVDDKIILFLDPMCIGNQALYMLLCSKVDNFYRNLIQHEHNLGDKALKLLKSYCASCTLVDKNHFHREFSSLRLINDETTTHFLKGFMIARTMAIIVDNVYSDDETVDLF
jgi:hypothetical protein